MNSTPMDWNNIENKSDQWQDFDETAAMDDEEQHQTDAALLAERFRIIQELQDRVRYLERQLKGKRQHATAGSPGAASPPSKKRRFASLPSTATPTSTRPKYCHHCGQELVPKCNNEDKNSDGDENEPMVMTGVATAAALTERSTKVPIYARRPNPIKTGTGLIDGRSNADLAFEEKLRLFKEYKEEFGSIAFIKNNPPAKYVPLIGAVVRLRKQYKAYRCGEGPAIPASRMQALDELGFQWSRQLSKEDRMEEFKRKMESLREFQETYGHCCVAAVRNRPDDDGLEKFVSQNRTYLKISSRSDDATDRKMAAKERVPPVYWSSEMRGQLLALDDPYLSGAEDELRRVMAEARKKGNITRLRVALNSHAWYQQLEEFRNFHKKNGHGFPVKAQSGDKLPLAKFVRTEHKVYDAIQDGKLESHPTIERNQELLKSIGFVYDKQARRNHEQKLAAAEFEAKLKQEKKNTPHGRLQVAREEASVVRAQLAEAKKAQRLANDALIKARNSMIKANKKINAAKKEAENDPVGSIVHVKSRGPRKPGGLARVTRVSVANVLGEEIKFYNVEYLNNENDEDKNGEANAAVKKKTESCIEGCFIESESAVSALLDLSKAVKVRPTQMITRSRSKPDSKEA